MSQHDSRAYIETKKHSGNYVGRKAVNRGHMRMARLFRGAGSVSGNHKTGYFVMNLESIQESEDIMGSGSLKQSCIAESVTTGD